MIPSCHRTLQIRLQAFAEAGETEDGIVEGDEKQQDGDDGKRGQRLCRGCVVLHSVSYIYAEELGEEVDQASYEEELATYVSQYNRRVSERRVWYHDG